MITDQEFETKTGLNQTWGFLESLSEYFTGMNKRQDVKIGGINSEKLMLAC